MGKNILLIQPPLLKQEMDVDDIQKGYWNTLNTKMAHIGKENGLNIELGKNGFIEPNIGLFYIAAVLKRSGYNIEYVDAFVHDVQVRAEKKRPIHSDDIKGLLKELPNESIHIAAISALTVNIGWAIEIGKMLKEINEKIIVILGGAHASFEYQNILEHENCIDIISVGEGEEAILEIADLLYENEFTLENLDKVSGVAYKQGGAIHFTGARPYIEDLDSLPYPLYELLPKEVMDSLLVRVVTSRGCSNNCSFCIPSKMFHNLRFRNPVSVVDELEYYNHTYGWEVFMIGDLNFLSDYKYAKIFCNELIKRKLPIHWICQSRVDLIDEEITKLMHEAGCIMICLGIESAEPEILKNSNKNIELDRSIAACNIVKKANMSLYTYWVFGLPGETHDSAHATIKLLRRLIDEKLIDYTHCTVCVPFPGSELYRHPSEFKINILTNQFEDYWMGCDYLGAGLPVMETEELSNYEIYAYWMMALAVVAGNLLKNE